MTILWRKKIKHLLNTDESSLIRRSRLFGQITKKYSSKRTTYPPFVVKISTTNFCVSWMWTHSVYYQKPEKLIFQDEKSTKYFSKKPDWHSVAFFKREPKLTLLVNTVSTLIQTQKIELEILTIRIHWQFGNLRKG